MVFSTYVEMILTGSDTKPFDRGVLHVCGDDPSSMVIVAPSYSCSPRMWR